MTAPVIDARYVSVVYQSGPVWSREETVAVRDLSIQIAEGETLGLVGESGSGKTTLGRLFLGLVSANEGAVLFNRKLIAANRSPEPGTLSVVLQHPEWALNPRLRLGVSIAEPLAVLGGMPRAARRYRVAEVLGLVGLDASFAERYPHELSGGQRQRVAIARALVTDPRFIVFDEAVSALDVSVQTQILNLIRDLQERQRFAALFISHDLAATRYVSHRMAVMYAGALMETAPVDRFYDTPAHPYSRALAASIDPERHGRYVLQGPPENVAQDACPLAPRCAMHRLLCDQKRPPLRPFEGGQVACHFAEEVIETL